MTSIALLGGGRMGEALLVGLRDGGFAADELVVAEADAGRRQALEAAHPGVRVVPSPAWAVAEADVVVVAVKPGDVAAALEAAGPSLPPDVLVVSIAAGVTIADLEALVGDRPVVRAMPNTPAVIGAGASAIAPGTYARDAHLDLAASVLGAVGVVERLTETELDAVTGLSGSGPAYVFLVAEALVEAGVLQGLSRDVANRLVTATLLGAARLLVEDGADAATLRATVTSPGGTTAAGLRVLEQAGVRAAFLDAVAAATARSRELGRRPD